MASPDAIQGYLARLERRLPASAWRRRTLAEVEDHLRSSAAEAAPAVGREEAERRAVERFGPAEALVRQLSVGSAAATVRRAGQLLALLFGTLAVASVGTWNGPWLTGQAAGWPESMATFLLVQVAWAAAAISWLRAWLSRHLVSLRPRSCA
jgi:hypothetical protein